MRKHMLPLAIILMACLSNAVFAQESSSNYVAVVVSKTCASEMYASERCIAELRSASSFAVGYPVTGNTGLNKPREVKEPPPPFSKSLYDLRDSVTGLYEVGRLDQKTVNSFLSAADEVERLDAALHPTLEIAAERAIHDQCSPDRRIISRDDGYRLSIREQLDIMNKLALKLTVTDDRDNLARHLKALAEVEGVTLSELAKDTTR